MGADIHAYIEYASQFGDDGKPEDWSNFGERFSNRDYGLFALLAGVRGDDGAVFAPRGKPEGRMAFLTEMAAHLFVDDRCGGEGFCTTEEAESYQKFGSKIEPRDGMPWRVEHPDWHSHSWLTTEEFQDVLRAYRQKYGRNPSPVYVAMAAAMEALLAEGLEVRLVFWFDN